MINQTTAFCNRRNFTFQEYSDDAHVDMRLNLLSGKYVPPAAKCTAVSNLTSAKNYARAVLEKNGLACIQLPKPLENDQFIGFCRSIGVPMIESDRAVIPYTDNSVILNLVSLNNNSGSDSLKPFSTDYITMHSEGSLRPLKSQPRYIVLMCVSAGSTSNTAQTFLKPMSVVAKDLSTICRSILLCTKYSDNLHGPTILRPGIDGDIFSFRDIDRNSMNYSLGDFNLFPLRSIADRVNRSIRELLVSIYDKRGVIGVQWTPGVVVAIDNHRYFHGRQAAVNSSINSERWLKRIRVR